MAQSRVPKFGNWENEQDVPYTQYFDKARKNKNGGKMINPNDPQDNLDAYTDNKRPIQPPRNDGESDARVREGTLKPKNDQQLSSQARHENSGRKTNIEHNRNLSSGEAPKRAGRQTGGSNRSVEQSPLHPQYQPRAGGRGSGSSVSTPAPSWDRKSSEGSNALAPNTPGRSKLRPARGDETPDKSAAVPKFGEWDENNPASADGFTHIFNKMREEKQSGPADIIAMPDDVSNSIGYRRANGGTQTSRSFFSWIKRLFFRKTGGKR